MHCTIRHSSRSVSAAKNSRKASPETSSTSKEEESDEEEVSSSPRMPTVYSMSWNNQVISKKSRDIAFRVVFASQIPILTGLMPHGTNHRTTESLS